MVRQACLDFKILPLKYNSNSFDHLEILQKIEKGLIELQEFLGGEGCYDEFYKGHAGQQLYIRPLFEIMSKQNKSKYGINLDGVPETPDLDFPTILPMTELQHQ